jgi:hypothetical protein
VVRRQVALKSEDGRRAGLGVVYLSQLEHPRHVLLVGGDDVGEFFLAVVRLVGQAEAALVQMHDVASGLAGVVDDVRSERPGYAGPARLPDQADQAGHVGHRVDSRQSRLDRRVPELLATRLVHEARVQVADLALLGSFRGLGLCGVLDDGADRLLGVVAQIDERAGHRAVFRYRRRVQPASVDVPEQVVLDTYRFVDVFGVDA